MFEAHIKLGQELIARLEQCRDKGIDRVASAIPVSNQEFSEWYNGIESLIETRFGKESVEFNNWQDLLKQRTDMVSNWIRSNPDTSTEIPYLNHIQTCLMFLTSLDSLVALPNTSATQDADKKPSRADHYIEILKNNPVIAILVVIAIILIGLANVSGAIKTLKDNNPFTTLAAKDLPPIPGDSGWILVGTMNPKSEYYISDLLYKTEKSLYPAPALVPRKGELLRLLAERNIIIAGYKTTGLAQQLEPPWRLNNLSDTDYTGVKLPKDSIVEVRDISLGSFPDQPVVVWVRVAAPSR